MNHDSGRCLGINMQTSLGTIRLYNVYEFNEHQDRTILWQALHQQQTFEGLIFGDFNVVLDPFDSTTGATTVTCSKKHYWDLVSQMHDLRDAWHMLHSNTGFTFHSQAHTKAWARLDRFYLLRVDYF